MIDQILSVARAVLDLPTSVSRLGMVMDYNLRRSFRSMYLPSARLVEMNRLIRSPVKVNL